MSACRILVVDDELTLGQALQARLPGHQVVVAVDAASALSSLVAGERYDIIVCDVMMPLMDGIEFHRRLAEVLPAEAERIVFVSGGALTGRVEAFFERVPNLILERPLDTEGLRSLVERRARGEAEPG